MATPRSLRGQPVPSITTDQMREVDRLMTEVVGVQLLQMMENAGRNLAELTRVLVGKPLGGVRAIAAAGGGNNGGGVLAAARNLVNWGASVEAVCTIPSDRLQGAPRVQATILGHMGVPLHATGQMAGEALRGLIEKADVVLDGVIGYGLRGAPAGAAGELLQDIARARGRVISLDVPSGVDATTGDAPGEHVRAAATLTLALPKTGLAVARVRGLLGRLFLGDIAVPTAVYEQIGVQVRALFGDSSVVELDVRDGEWFVKAPLKKASLSTAG